MAEAVKATSRPAAERTGAKKTTAVRSGTGAKKTTPIRKSTGVAKSTATRATATREAAAKKALPA